MKLFDRDGVTAWRVRSEDVQSYRDAYPDYRRILAELAAAGAVEVGRSRVAKIGGETLRASHLWVYPGRDDIVMTSGEGDGVVSHGIVYEDKSAEFSPDDFTTAIGVDFGGTIPPIMNVHNLRGKRPLNPSIQRIFE